MTRRKKGLQKAAGQPAAARRAQRRTAVGAVARETQDVRQFAKTRAGAIQAHIQARGQRQQAKRDSR
jgi:hypothetical protein